MISFLLRAFAFCFLLLQGIALHSQTPSQVIQTVNDRFGKVENYSGNAQILCDIPFIRIKPITAKVYYEKPDKFRIKADGIMVLPKQDPGFIFTTLADTSAYTAVRNGSETYKNKVCEIISIIPDSDEEDLILGKFWIEKSKGLVHKALLTTRKNGTLNMESEFGSQAAYSLPDKMIFTIDVKKFKMPRAVAGDLGEVKKEENQNAKNKGIITIDFSNYAINKGVDPSVFKK